MSAKPAYRSAEAKAWQHLYGLARWRRMRLAQLRAEPLCARCLKQGKVVAATVAHHKIPHKGRVELFFSAENLASSCKPCHDVVEQGVEVRGFEIGVDAAGRPTSPDHPWNKAT